MIEQICEFPISASCAVEHSEALPPKADVVIVGGGIIGITTAYYLAKAGLKPVVLEKGRVAGEQSARNWGWIRQQGRDLAELPIMIEANQLWKEIAQELDQDIGLTHCGVTYFSSQEAEISRYEDWLKDAVPMGVDSKLLSSRALSDMIPGMSRLYSAALHTASDMKAEPFAAVPAIARAAKRRGAVIVENCAARVLDRAGGRVAGVVTERGLIETKEVIVAGGAWSSLFLRNEGVDIPQLSVSATVAATKTLPLIHDGAAAGESWLFVVAKMEVIRSRPRVHTKFLWAGTHCAILFVIFHNCDTLLSRALIDLGASGAFLTDGRHHAAGMAPLKALSRKSGY